MLNHGKSDSGTKINLSNGNYIFIYPESILTAVIQVRDKQGFCLWSKPDCTVIDIPFAIEIGMRNINTGTFEN